MISENDGLQRDVEALNGKIDRLQADVEARNRPKPEQEPATALVFRDQHVEEVRNYAIAGGDALGAQRSKPRRRFHSPSSIFLPRSR